MLVALQKWTDAAWHTVCVSSRGSPANVLSKVNRKSASTNEGLGTIRSTYSSDVDDNVIPQDPQTRGSKVNHLTYFDKRRNSELIPV